MRRASQLGSAQKGGRRVSRGSQEQHADGGDSTFLTSLPGERQHHLPTIDGLQVCASDDLEERLDALSQAIGLEGTKLLKGALQAEFTHICRLSREDEKESLMRQGQGMENKELRRLLKEQEQLREASQASVEVLQEQLRMVAQRTQELQAKNEAMESMDAQLRGKVASKDEEIVTLKGQVHDAGLRTRAEETEKVCMPKEPFNPCKIAQSDLDKTCH